MRSAQLRRIPGAPSGDMHFMRGEEPARGVGFIDFAPFLVQQCPNALLRGSNLLQLIKAVEEQVTHGRDIGLALHPQMGDACADKDREGHAQQQRPFLGASARGRALSSEWKSERSRFLSEGLKRETDLDTKCRAWKAGTYTFTAPMEQSPFKWALLA